MWGPECHEESEWRVWKGRSRGGYLAGEAREEDWYPPRGTNCIDIRMAWRGQPYRQLSAGRCWQWQQQRAQGHKLDAERNRRGSARQAGESGRAEVRKFPRGPLRSLDFSPRGNKQCWKALRQGSKWPLVVLLITFRFFSSKKGRTCPRCASSPQWHLPGRSSSSWPAPPRWGPWAL